MSEKAVFVRLAQAEDYRFDVDFGVGPTLRVDEPAPLGAGSGPNPLMLLGTAVGNCLSASLLFALRKFKQAPDPLRADVTVETGRNEQGRLRVQRIAVRLQLGVPAAQLQHLDRVLSSFETYCTVTQSVAAAIPVDLEVFDSAGVRLKPGALQP
ncbi:OsmC family protein [Inhella sp.]|uniref:OsmC family protein n=1 Tax=Inhella sp. TaxID=1921806 RepID=UPI0035B087AA